VSEQAAPSPAPSDSGGRKKRGRLFKLLGAAGLLILFAGSALLWWNNRLDRRTEQLLKEAQLRTAEVQVPYVDPEDDGSLLYLQAIGAAAMGDANVVSNIDRSLENCELEIGSQEVADFLKANRETVKVLARAGAKPKRVFYVDYSKGLDADLPSFRALRHCMELLALQARREAHDGHGKQAVQRIRETLLLSRAIWRVGFLICCYMGRAGEEIAVSALRDVLGQSGLDAASLEAALAVLREHAERRPNLGETMRVDRDFTLLYCAEVLAGRRSYDHGGPIAGLKFKAQYLTGKLHEDHRALERLWDCAASIPIQAGPESTPAELRLEALEDKLERLSPLYQAAATRLSGVLRGERTSLARLRAARLALGCCLLQKRRGAPPRKLGELTAALPAHFEAVPPDPFSGKPMLYRLTKGGFAVYSVGCYDPGDDGAPNLYDDTDEPDIVFAVDPGAYRDLRQKRIQRRKKRGPRPAGRY
jgi:hypothetical protein